MSRGAAESLLAVIDKDLPEVTFKPRPSKDSVESMLRLHPQQGRSERSELALIQNETVANHTEVRTILPLFEDVLHFIVPNGSEIMEVRLWEWPIWRASEWRSGHPPVVARSL
ncbi:hypothetical protein N9094_01415 [bacterium]|jgi:hypothetical protein|nr:hypothetical protein [bacterium]MDC0312479.1 hypothetical protein [Verrucomicrobiales bacterium]